MMASIMKWLHERCEKVRKVRLETWLSYLAILVLISPFIPFVRNIWLYETQWNGDATRSVILALGGIGALYGLLLANQRIIISEKYLFSEEYSKALSFLNSEEVASRLAGIYQVTNLFWSKPPLSNERVDIYEILVGCLHEWCSFKRGYRKGGGFIGQFEEGSMPPPRKSSGTAIVFLIALRSSAKLTVDEPSRLLDFEACDFRGVGLFTLDLTDVTFSNCLLHDCHFDDCNLKQTSFGLSDISNASFADAQFLTQEKIDECVYEYSRPPRNLPKALNGSQIVANPKRAYEFFEKEPNQMFRRYVESRKEVGI